MQIYLAPMEGITGHVYRRVYSKIYKGVDKYFTPFIATNQTFKMKNREKREIDPKYNEGMNVIPQLLTNNAQQFVWYAREIQKLGYKEVNLNAGCPSGTVVAKRKGSGMLSDLDIFDEFLDEVFTTMGNEMDISIKTRLGISDFSEIEDIINLYNKYPIKELTIHPRTRDDFYKNKVSFEAFELANQLARKDLPICFNGDIKTVEDAINVQQKYQNVKSIMLGRGILANPNLPEQIVEKKVNLSSTEYYIPEISKLEELAEGVFQGYLEEFTGEKDAVNRMKEFWIYLANPLMELNGMKKALKAITKSKDKKSYEVANKEMFRLLRENKN